MIGNSYNKGTTVLEMAVTTLLIAILVSGFGTGMYSTVSNARNQAALRQLEALKKAIVGQPRSVPPGEKSGIRHGYIGDMGALPATLSSLDAIGSQLEYSVDSLLQLPRGWRGPYVSGAASRNMTDPWGNGLVYSAAAGASALTGATTVATIRSLGADGLNGTADDHVVEIYKAEAFAKVIGFVKDAFGSTVAGITVTVSYPSSGSIATVSGVSDNDGLYMFDNIPHGPQILQLAPKLSYQRGTGLTTGAARNNVEFVVENLGKLATNITNIKLTWTTDPPTDFKTLAINGVQVYNATAPSGTTVSFSATTVAGTGVIQEPFRVDISALVMQIPDTIIGTVGTGGAVKFELGDFEEVGTTTNFDMTGVTFVAEFSDGSKTLFSPLRK